MTLNGVSYEAEGTKETVRNEVSFKALSDLDAGIFLPLIQYLLHIIHSHL